MKTKSAFNYREVSLRQTEEGCKLIRSLEKLRQNALDRVNNYDDAKEYNRGMMSAFDVAIQIAETCKFKLPL